jgi:osmoprotectant transport system ATP-binding protein
MFSLVGVGKTYDSVAALHDIDLAIAPEQTTALIGPSGCGKSTLIRLLAGLVRPDIGQILFQDTPLTDANIQQIRHRMGYVIQEGGLFPHMTVRGNITLLARYLGRKQATIRQRLDELCELTQLPAPMLDRFPSEHSGGQRQRVSLMRGLMLDPDVLLLDEPLGALDPMIRFDLQQDLKRIFQQLRKTVVLVTHDLNEAAFLGHTIVLMRDGQIVQEGPSTELVNHPRDAFVTRFVRAQRHSLDVPEDSP